MPTSNLSLSHHFSTNPSTSTMDWFSWLSRTSLEPSLIYDYGLIFARNELQLEDASHFNHEFLQSMGVSIAKHRLEILKLVKKEQVAAAARPKKLSGVIKRYLRKCMNKFVFQEHEVKKNLPVPVPVPVTQPEANWYQEKWKGAVVKKDQNQKEERRVPVYKSRTIALSGPLDGRMHEKMVHNKSLKLSGPIDGRMNERMMMYTNRSPLVSKPLERRFTAPPRSPRGSGPLEMMVENRTPRMTRLSDAAKVETDNSMGYSPYNKPRDDFDYDEDEDHTLWPTLFQDLKPT